MDQAAQRIVGVVKATAWLHAGRSLLLSSILDPLAPSSPQYGGP